MSDGVVSAVVTMPLINLLVVCGTLLLVVLAVSFILHNSGYIQFGPFTIKKEQEGQTTMHSMNEENDDLDDYLHVKLRGMTNALRQRIINMFDGYQNCTMTKRALASAIRFPLYESVNNNHFTKELMPGQFEKYRRRILNSLEDEYKDIRSTSEMVTCTSEGLPDWKTASVIIEQLLDTWLLDTANLVQDCSRQKLEVYNKYLAVYEESKDKFRINITKQCIEKNTRYVEALDRLSENLGKDIENRERAVAG